MRKNLEIIFIELIEFPIYESRSLKWKLVFAAPQRGVDAVDTPTSSASHALEKAPRLAVLKSGLTNRITCHAFRHTFATQLLESGYHIFTVQELLGHDDDAIRELYACAKSRGQGVISPADRLVRQ